jgi:hypothetical protein
MTPPTAVPTSTEYLVGQIRYGAVASGFEHDAVSRDKLERLLSSHDDLRGKR